MFKNITRLALEHKFVVGIAIAFLAYGGYWGYKKMTDTRGETKKLEADLKKAYEDGFNETSNAFLDLPAIMAGLNDLLFKNNFISSQTNLNYYSDAVKSYDEKAVLYKDDAFNSYQAARKAYDQNFT